jgi:hypothetical protein
MPKHWKQSIRLHGAASALKAYIFIRILHTFGVTTSKISSDRGASQKSCDVTAGP